MNYRNGFLNNPDGTRSDYLCEIADITSEILDEVINDLPQSIKPNKKLIESIAPKCQI